MKGSWKSDRKQVLQSAHKLNDTESHSSSLTLSELCGNLRHSQSNVFMNQSNKVSFFYVTFTVNNCLKNAVIFEENRMF